MPAALSVKRPKYSVRPFFISTFIITLLATYALFIRGPPISPQAENGASYSLLEGRSKAQEPECNTVRDAKDKCAFVLRYCDDDEAGLIQYLTFYYCTMGNAKPVAFVIMVVWLGLLFSTIGIAASDFFSVNLSTIASILGLSESLAGVTFLAFGNGSPDVFSTFAAMGSNSGSMAVGELIGAAGFITAVVAGSMALVREFKVSKRTFVRDICFFIVAVGFAIGFLADGSLKLWECFTMIGFYVFYVITVVGWHWVATRRKQKRVKDSTARSHVYAPVAHGADELEPYRDEEDEDDTAPVGGRSRSAPEPADISALERAPLIEVDGASPVDEEERGVHIAAEMTSSMRVNRPRWGRSNTTITPIRPSLVGALEFRSVLASLQRARNMHLTPLPPRDYFDTPHVASSSVDDLRAQYGQAPVRPAVPAAARDRALSSGNMPLNLDSVRLPRPDFVVNTSSPPDSPHQQQQPIRPIAGVLQPDGQDVAATLPQLQPSSRGSGNLRLQIPSPSGRSSGNSSPALSPFPGLSESPMPMSPNPQAPAANFIPNTQGGRRSSRAIQLGEQDECPRPVKWWPYKVLPPPHILLATLFPTLQGWGDKTIWDKMVSAVSVPSIFLLVVTLPVVETDNDDPEDAVADGTGSTPLGGPVHAPAPVSVEDNDDVAIEPETVWQHYRRRTRSVNSRNSPNPSPHIIALNHAAPPQQQAAQSLSSIDTTTFPTLPEPAKPFPASNDRPLSISPSSLSESLEWHRWLVALQLFTGPLFVTLILWANMEEDMPNPTRTLVRLILYSLLGSVVALGVLLLTTSSYKKPKYHSLLCFLGFIISIAWISTVAGEVVGVLKALGVILGISEAILGLTVFAVGNSLGDLVADVTVARLGYPVMALAACFGGPMLNILLGVGIGGAWMIIKTANEKHRKHPDRPAVYKPYKIEVGETLLVSAVTVLITLVALLVVVPWNKWVMSRKIGWGLIALWTAGTVVNLVVEMTGPWSEVA
ncbi:Sodium/calcium exchanger protein-domain-containing protein [Coniochaeta sp. 2T2.1]|nr:Sodium/calcium exchanger protein-domain-containing protein [Coniochaeta sp. 2T2.1]